MSDKPLSIDDLAERWGTSRAGVYNLRHRDRIPDAFKVGRSLFWRAEDIEAWEAANVTARPPTRHRVKA